MTLENCQKLLKHYNELIDGTIPKPFGHKDWQDVIYNAKVRAAEMQKRIEWKTSDGFKTKHGIPISVPQKVVQKETKSKEKK